MVSFLCRDDECIVRKPEVDAGLWHNIGLELRDVNIQYVIKSQRNVNKELICANKQFRLV